MESTPQAIKAATSPTHLEHLPCLNPTSMLSWWPFPDILTTTSVAFIELALISWHSASYFHGLDTLTTNDPRSHCSPVSGYRFNRIYPRKSGGAQLAYIQAIWPRANAPNLASIPGLFPSSEGGVLYLVSSLQAKPARVHDRDEYQRLSASG